MTVVHMDYNTPWRKVASAIYGPPLDGRISGSFSFDITETERFMLESRRAGKALTLTSVMAAILARTLAYDVPEGNVLVRRGRVVPRKSVGVCVSVSVSQGSELAALIVPDAHIKPVSQIAQEIHNGARQQRREAATATARSKNLLSRVPWPFRRWTVRLLRWLTADMGLQLATFGLTNDGFGSVLLSNLGTHGLQSGTLALMPIANVPIAVAIGRPERQPVVRDEQIVIRSMLPMTSTFDHRVFDAAMIGKLVKSMSRYLEKPELLERVPETAASPGEA